MLDVEVEAFLDYLAVDRAASPHTCLAYRQDLEMTINFLLSQEIRSWESLTNELMTKIESFLAKGCAPSTLQRRMSSLRSFLKYRVKSGIAKNSVLPEPGISSRSKILPKSLSIEDTLSLLNAIDASTYTGLRDRTILEVLYGGGLRVSEAVNMSLHDCDEHFQTLRVTGKRQKTRIVPLPQETSAWLEKYCKIGRPYFVKQIGVRSNKNRISSLEKDPLFLNNHGYQMLRQNILKVVREAALRAGLSSVPSPHTLRHSYAVHLLRGGADLRVVQELLGHESLATTQIYTQLDLEAIRESFRIHHPRQ